MSSGVSKARPVAKAWAICWSSEREFGCVAEIDSEKEEDDEFGDWDIVGNAAESEVRSFWEGDGIFCILELAIIYYTTWTVP